MKNLNPHGHRKEISREVKREIKPFEEKYIKSILHNPAKLVKIYETENSNWNLFLMQDDKFLSIPKTDKQCAPSFFGDTQHAEKYHEFINLTNSETMKILTPHPQHPDFLLHVITNDWYLFVNPEESDETTAVKMTDKDLNLISDNFLASDYLFSLLLDDSDIIAISDEMKHNQTEILKEAN